MSTVTVRMQVKPEKHDDFLEMLRDVIAQVDAHEPDCLVYSVWETGTPYEYFLVESYRTEEARALHNERHKHIAEAFFACLAGPPQAETLGKLAMGIPK